MRKYVIICIKENKNKNPAVVLHSENLQNLLHLGGEALHEAGV